MLERRAARRVAIDEAALGSLSVIQDVEVCRVGTSEITVFVDGQVDANERLRLHLTLADGTPMDVSVRAAERRAVVAGGRVLQQVRLEILKASFGDRDL
jgi:hypothetical protein